MKKTLFFAFLTSLAVACSSGGGEKGSSADESSTPPGKKETPDPKANKGIGPVTEVTLSPEIDQTMAAEGKALYDVRCTACHQIEKDYIGPSPKGLLDRRSPEWIMNMILNPEEMVQKDPIAKQVYEEYNMAPMANMGLSQEEARKVLEYLRTIN